MTTSNICKCGDRKESHDLNGFGILVCTMYPCPCQKFTPQNSACEGNEFKNNSQESPRVEKLDEMPDYETTNGVVDKDTRIPSNSSKFRTHPDSYSQIPKIRYCKFCGKREYPLPAEHTEGCLTEHETGEENEN